ncbi:MAG: aminomuconate-semialdehyde/2-hydroxymuconate-6-semialdehyde dehydrogenase [Myxococcota bacterium]|jgi:aminomuconate-semialdehyde/2-hydroxymuconate-6-semialdehyde dehydrogenase
MTVRGLGNHIDGADRPARSGHTLDDTNPATGRTVATIPDSDAADVGDAVAAAVAARRVWSGWSTSDRADLCDAVADALEARLDAFAQLESEDTGKPISLARRIDIPRAVANFRFFAGAVRHSHTGAHEMADAINYTLRRPLGVVGLITPWNLPLYLLTWKVAPALATGNTIVAKPSELTPQTAAALANLVTEVGAPAGVFNVVHGLGPKAGQALVAHADVAGISFTGGTQTGRIVGATASQRFAKLSLELGGKNATVVFADADLDAAVAGAARAAFTNQGQVCLCGSRILVERTIHDAFVERLVAHVSAMKVGDPSDPATQLGAVVSLGHRSKVEGYIALAAQEGGTVVAGGKRPSLPPPFDGGAFVEPTLVTGLAPGCRTAQEEIFGPVATVHAFDDEAEAVAIANSVRYGLAASVWTTNLGRAHRVSAALDTGMVWVNCWLKRDLRVPFGGTKESGVGREGGAYSLSFYTEDKNVCIQL